MSEKELEFLRRSKLTDQEIADSLSNLRTVVAAGDKKGMAEMVRYPLTVLEGGREKVLTAVDEFVRDYDRIVYPQLKDAVAHASPDTVSVNPTGIMIGNGHVWLGKTCLDETCTKSVVQIIAINPAVPDALYRRTQSARRTNESTDSK